jgi:hypothetical protein
MATGLHSTPSRSGFQLIDRLRGEVHQPNPSIASERQESFAARRPAAVDADRRFSDSPKEDRIRAVVVPPASWRGFAD